MYMCGGQWAIIIATPDGKKNDNLVYYFYEKDVEVQTVFCIL